MKRVRQPRPNEKRSMTSRRSRSRRAFNASVSKSIGGGPLPGATPRPSAARRRSRVAVAVAIPSTASPPAISCSIVSSGTPSFISSQTRRNTSGDGFEPARKNSCVRTSAGENSSAPRAGRPSRPARPTSW